MINKILIANRGEIAVRILRACHELGIATVAVYSDADRNAMHVHRADQAYYIGPSAARESYLRADKILDAARKSGADAIHPGYGFLSERADFASACAAAGLAFIGPPPGAISVMGDKARARAAALAAGVPIVPGTDARAHLSDAELIAAAADVGFPLLVKAAAGGGGKGMRSAASQAELPAALAAAHSESLAAFGDGTLYLERLLPNARHIEVQILADMEGNVIHLGERECSIQRRHQKLLEEAPSPFVGDDEELRQRMGALACKVASAVGYANAGTVEFLMDEDRNLFFLEMNTRLQVEHPVTELVTGIDIVKEQIRIARGRKLSRKQSEVRMTGHAIECRINSEDPYNGFLPSIGTITTSILPTGPGVRVDTGVYAGYTVSPYYDSLLTKLICYGESRGEALLRMRRALEDYRLIGVKTTIPFHQKLLDSHRFMAGKFTTRFLDEDFHVADKPPTNPRIAAILATLVAHQQGQQTAHIQQHNVRDTSNWKWVGRWERMHR
jgi:acetyl-CoA carboxylase biotin carboxylase subunit